ncbi:hypothetical protein SCOCK_780010 [Actinacidiphila cocklensis]|uniref:Uncharacterized protein n=1 Tax=Actinacidiphila cocklensis TaxID=887465 RepID=A0A9W4DZP8_9ACTN|nr:hypothetical protein SCOCK_780010 [Actinacidiphila cocklensis]
MCPMRDLLRGGVGTYLGYAPSGARTFTAAPRNHPVEPGGAQVWALHAPSRAPRSMQHPWSIAMEYDGSACWSDCRSIMLCEVGVTHGDPGQA